jgi:hypothetical protein
MVLVLESAKTPDFPGTPKRTAWRTGLVQFSMQR